MNLLDKHIGRHILTSILLVFLVLLVLFAFVAFVDALGDVGKAQYGVWEAARYVALSLPRQLYELLPMAALLGTLLGLSALAMDSELIAMRAAGVSLLRIAGAALKVGLLLVLIGFAIGEFLAPVAQNAAERGRSQALGYGVLRQADGGLWMRDGQTFVYLSEVLPDLSVLGVDLYQLDESNRLQSQISARQARYAGKQWHLSEVRESIITPGRVSTRRAGTLDWQSVVTPDMLSVFTVRPEALSVWQLFRYLRHLEMNKQDTSRYAMAFWQKLVAPFATLVMVFVAIPFVFVPLRSGGLGVRLFLGILLGLAFFVISRGSGYFGLLYGVSPAVGALMPLMVFGLLGWRMLKRQS